MYNMLSTSCKYLMHNLVCI